MSSASSSIRDIPGYYYDTEKRRYFKIVNGANPNESKYHNNSIQSEKRQLKFTKKKPPPRKQLNNSRFKSFKYDSIGLLNMKTGSVDLSSLFYQYDLIDALKSNIVPCFKPELVINGVVLLQYQDWLFIHNEFVLDSMTNPSTFSSPLKLQNLKSERIIEINHTWESSTSEVDQVTFFDYYHSNQMQEVKVKVRHSIIDDKLYILCLYLMKNSRGYSWFIKFNVFDGTVVREYSQELMDYVTDEISKLPEGSLKMKLNHGFQNTSIGAINESSICHLSKNTICLFLQNIIITLEVTSDGFCNCRFQALRPSLMSNFEFHKHESKFYFNTSKCIYKYNKNRLEKILNVDKSIRKIFVLDSDKFVIITIDEILLYNNQMIKIDDYLNDNNPFQQFEVFRNHLIFNIGKNEFMIYNLCRSENNVAKLKINYNYQIVGYFKNFKLVKIIEMRSDNNRLKLGFTFDNSSDKVTIFETYLI